jgi:hypothetical protein
MLHTRGPIFKVLQLFQVIVITRGDIPRSVALVLGDNKLLAMVKYTSGLRPIAANDMFL